MSDAPYTLPPLPYAPDALAPHLSAETLDYHYGKHHKAYADKLKAAIEGTDLEKKSLEEIVTSSQGGIFNNAAQLWNHTFYWKCMKPGGGGAPSGDLAKAIDGAFGSFDEFAKKLSNESATHFGSGWGWLVKKDGKLDVVSTHDAGNPLTDGATPLLTIDVWEHAYYIDFRNARPKYIETFLSSLVNWDFVAQNLADAG